MNRLHIFITSVMCSVFITCCHADQTLTIGAFNVRRFGPTKASNKVVMDKLVKICIQYDIILIQEITDATGRAIKQLMTELNQSRGLQNKFELEISPRVGFSSYKEQYAFIYRKDRVEVESSMMYPDEHDIMSREPFIVQFSAKHSGAELTIAGAHLSPDSVAKEINEMDNVYDYIKKTLDTSTVLLMGDFNADCDYLSRRAFKKLDFNTRSEFTWLLPENADTTVGKTDCSYDRFIADSAFVNYYRISKAEVHRFDLEQNLDQQEALAVSDHYPIRIQVQPSRRSLRDYLSELAIMMRGLFV